MWGVKENLLLLVTPFIAITVLFLVTQVRFWSLAPLQKNKSEEMGQAEGPRSQICGVLRSDFSFFPLKGKKLFFTGTFKVPQL